jgi:malonyl-CoA/methylmalonyl-CoA synthetase
MPFLIVNGFVFILSFSVLANLAFWVAEITYWRIMEKAMHNKSIHAWFESVCSKRSEEKAITFLRDGITETMLTYSELRTEVSRFAGTLRDRGISKGDRVILFLEKSLIFAVAHLALQALGAVSIPLNTGFKKGEMQYLLKDADASLVLCDTGKGDWIRQIDPSARSMELPTHKPYQKLTCFESSSGPSAETTMGPEDPGLIIYTSGTTGNPKGAVLTQKNLMQDAANIIDIWEITQNDVLCHTLPLFHIHGLCFALHTALLSGAHVLMLDRFEPAFVLDVLASKDKDRTSIVYMAVPTMYTRLMDFMGEKTIDFSNIRLLTSGSAPLLIREFNRIEASFGKKPVEREGMSETGMNFSNPLRGERKPGSIGLPLPRLEVRIVDPNRFVDLPLGEIGEIWLKGPCITPGYWRKPKETRETFKDGWFRTGDLGYVDAKGYYYLTDRIKHIIITGGENVSAKELETVINRIDKVVESAVVGIPDPKWGEKIAAVVVTEPGSDIDANTIQTYCKEHLHSWKTPREIRFVEMIPKNTMGKILKEKVKKIFTA